MSLLSSLTAHIQVQATSFSCLDPAEPPILVSLVHFTTLQSSPFHLPEWSWEDLNLITAPLSVRPFQDLDGLENKAPNLSQGLCASAGSGPSVCSGASLLAKLTLIQIAELGFHAVAHGAGGTQDTVTRRPCGQAHLGLHW